MKSSPTAFKFLTQVFSTCSEELTFNKTIFIQSLFVCLLFFGVNVVSAQDEKTQTSQFGKIEKEEYKAFKAGAHIKNMHTWHGFVVHPGAMLAVNLEFNSRNEKFTFGFWGGTSFSGIDIKSNDGELVNANYQEFTPYAVYRFSDKFFVEAVSHNNYTGVEERGDVLNYWSYDKTQGYNFVDISFGYNVSKNTLLYFATILEGGSGDFEVEADGSLEDSWTHYFEIKSKVWQKEETSLSLFVGGAWSFITDKTFYTESAGNLINVGAVYSDKIKIGKLKLPVELMAMWNPEKEKTVLQIDFTIF